MSVFSLSAQGIPKNALTREHFQTRYLLLLGLTNPSDKRPLSIEAFGGKDRTQQYRTFVVALWVVFRKRGRANKMFQFGEERAVRCVFR
ncbi:MAG: hypothetical protein JNL70_20050 [Saprospiraceae bacterium]|nr:hypothetical protein [Saprospiraceae bacterium]